MLRTSALTAVCLVMVGCGGEPKPISFTAEYDRPADKHILTVTELLGPPGAKPGDIKAGWYTVRGNYDLTGTPYDHGLIRFSIGGSYDLEVPNDNKDLTVEQILSVGEPMFVIPKGQLQGAFELRMGIKKVKDKEGKGPAALSFEGNQTTRRETMTAHETVSLK